MRSPTVIAVCGLSGVGKTRLINRFLQTNAHATRLSAGEIIAHARNVADPEFLRKLSDDELNCSQELLITGFPRALANITSSLLLLDAHTVIDSGNEELYLVNSSVFIALRPYGIIHVEADPAAIVRQREADSGRKRPYRTADTLNIHQQISADHSQAIALELGVWFSRVQSGDFEAFGELLRQHL